MLKEGASMSSSMGSPEITEKLEGDPQGRKISWRRGPCQLKGYQPSGWLRTQGPFLEMRKILQEVERVISPEKNLGVGFWGTTRSWGRSPVPFPPGNTAPEIRGGSTSGGLKTAFAPRPGCSFAFPEASAWVWGVTGGGGGGCGFREP